MTFENALNLKLAKFDQWAVKFRKVLAEPDHLNDMSSEMQILKDELTHITRDTFQLKAAWADANRDLQQF